MTTLKDVAKKRAEPPPSAEAATAELVRLAKAQGLSLTVRRVCSSSSPKLFWNRR